MLILTCCYCCGCCCTGLQLELTHFSEKKSFLVLYSSSFLSVLHNMVTHWVNFPTMKCIFCKLRFVTTCFVMVSFSLWFFLALLQNHAIQLYWNSLNNRHVSSLFLLHVYSIPIWPHTHYDYFVGTRLFLLFYLAFLSLTIVVFVYVQSCVS